MAINQDAIKELESADPDELVSMLGITSEQLIRAFPGHTFDYINENFSTEDGSLLYENESDFYEEMERLVNEEFSIYRVENPEDET